MSARPAMLRACCSRGVSPGLSCSRWSHRPPMRRTRRPGSNRPAMRSCSRAASTPKRPPARSRGQHRKSTQRGIDLRFALHEALDGAVLEGVERDHGEPPGGMPQHSYGEYRAFAYVHLIALGGLPAASVPVGREDGLPVGVQVAAAPYREDNVLAVAAALEAAA